MEKANKKRRFRILAAAVALVLAVTAVAVYSTARDGDVKKELSSVFSADKTACAMDGCGVYVDGVFIAAVRGSDIAAHCRDELASLLAEVCGAPEGEHTLVNEWSAVNGAYHKNTFVTAEGLLKLLGARDGGFEYKVSDVYGKAHDLSLSVMTETSSTEEADVAYDTVYVPTDLLEVGEEITVNEGKVGMAHNSYDLTYIDGVCTEKLFVNSTLIKSPVSAEVWQGTDSKASLMGAEEKLMLPYNGYVTSWYGYRMLWGELDFHNGIDFAGYGEPCYGDPIYASADGIVTFAGYHGGFGLKVVLSHSSDFATLYAHCSKIVVEEGEAVEKGQIIAYIGATGRATGPHLHYGVVVKGVEVNPKPYLDWSDYKYYIR